jgi:hypothetical protein
VSITANYAKEEEYVCTTNAKIPAQIVKDHVSVNTRNEKNNAYSAKEKICVYITKLVHSVKHVKDLAFVSTT